MKQLFVIAFCFYILSSMTGCKEELVIKEQGYQTTPFDLYVPVAFPEVIYHPENPMTVEGVNLGRMLYYDSILDINQNRACASCHIQSNSFTGPSNALVHVNLAWSQNFLWKGEVQGLLEDIMLFEAQDFFKTDLTTINADTMYRRLFKEAFGVENISYTELAFALAQFERTKISYRSKYDFFLKGQMGITPDEEAGLNIYFSEKGDCFHCHGGTLLSDNLFHNTGLDSIAEEGRMAVTKNANDRGKFKTPTLRNIALSTPYMHDGRFSTLEEVIEFYSTGVKYSETIDPLMKQVHQGGVQLTSIEQAQLVAFLHCFTDLEFTQDPALANPF